MSVRFTCDALPPNPELKTAAGLPFGCLVKPFAPLPSPEASTAVPARDVARCSNCYAYINPYIRWSWQSWRCSLCRTWNSGTERYKGRESDHHPELKRSAVEFVKKREYVRGPPSLWSKPSSSKPQPQMGPSASLRKITMRHPIYIFMVDVTGTSEAIRVIKRGLLESLDALPPDVWVGLVTSSSKIGFHDLRSRIPHVLNVRIRDDGTLFPPISECLSLDQIIIPLHSAKEFIRIAIDSLDAEDSTESGLKSPSSFDALKWPSIEPLTAQMRSVFKRFKENEGKEESLLPLHSPKSEETAKDPFKRPDGGSSHGPKGEPEKKTPASRQNGFGSTLRSLIDILDDATVDAADSHKEMRLSVRLVCFITSRPNYGVGKIPPPSSKAHHDLRLGDTSPKFYEELASRAAGLGICVDMYAACQNNNGVGLPTLKHLPLTTGGNLRLYNELSHQSCTLPQDLYKQLRTPHAFAGLLRIRTSSDFLVGKIYGNLTRDETYENIVCVPGCDSSKTFAVGFDYANHDGFVKGSVPVVQVAFEYTCIEKIPANEATAGTKENKNSSQEVGNTASDGDSKIGKARYAVVTRLRVITAKAETARHLKDVYDSANPEVVITHLTHQAIDEANKYAALKETQDLLREWLVDFLVGYETYFKKSTESFSFKEAPDLKEIPRLIFALIKSSLLRPEDLPHDARVHLHSIYTSMEPDLVLRGLYPSLSSWKSLDAIGEKDLPLTKISISNEPLYVLDAVSAIVVLYTHAAFEMNPPIQFPPKAFGSELAAHIKRLKKECAQLSPRVIYVKVGGADYVHFECHLVEEPSVAGDGYAQFSESLRKEVLEVMEE